MAYHKAIVITTLGKHTSSYQMADLADDFDDGSGPRKRRRLTHLTPDEKVLRRKLKNRVAAQTARDRKKALMSDLEEQVIQLQEEKKALQRENQQLRSSHAQISKENHCLKKLFSVSSVASSPSSAAITSTPAPAALPSPLTTTEPSSPAVPLCKVEAPDSHEVCGSPASLQTEPVSPGSAAPAVSLPKEQIQALSRVMMHCAASALTISLMLCFASWKSACSQRTESSSRKRKQPNPAKRSLAMEESLLPVKSEGQMGQVWWGPQQRTWTPSMN